MAAPAPADHRPFAPLSAQEQAALLRDTPNLGDRLLLRVLLDRDQGDDLGAFPGYRLLADLTGWAPKTVLNRLSGLTSSGRVKAIKGGVGTVVRYFVAPPSRRDIPRDRDMPHPKRAGYATSHETGMCDIPSTSRETGSSIKQLHSTHPNPEMQGGAKQRTARVSQEPWLAPFGKLWIARFDGVPPWGRIGKAVKALREMGKTETEILEAWKRYLEDRDEQFANPQDFVQKYGLYARTVRVEADEPAFPDYPKDA
jgi:hypothetical protein